MNDEQLKQQIDNDLDRFVEEAKNSDGYAAAITYRKKVGELNRINPEGDDQADKYTNYHNFVRYNFPNSEIVTQLDACIKTLRISKPPVPEVITPIAKDWTQEKKLRIAILTHLNHAPDSFSPAQGIKNQVKMLVNFGHDVSLFVAEGSKLDYGCAMKPCIPKFKREKWIVNEEVKNKFIDILRRELTDNYDVVLVHDYLIGDAHTYMEAIRNCGVKIPFLVWARSGVGEMLNLDTEHFRWVYMNYADSEIFAKHLNVPLEKVRCVFNVKDPAVLFDWDDTTKMIVEKTRLYDADIAQVYPICTSRMSAKGLPSVIEVFGKLKELGNKVRLIICNSNGKRRGDEINNMLNLAERAGLTKEEVIFTSLLANEQYPIYSEVPHKTVMNLMRMSNLMIFPTHAEVCSNLLLEGAISRALLVVNDDLNIMYDFVQKENVLYHPFTSLHSLHFNKRDEDSMMNLAKAINGQLKSNKSDLSFRYVWRRHRMEWVYENQMAPVLYEAVEDFKNGKL